MLGSFNGERARMITEDAPRADDAALSRPVPIDDNARAALGLLRQAYTCSEDTGADLWDFALEVGRLYDGGMTVSDLRWLVARKYVEYGQELSDYGGPHRSFHRGASSSSRRTRASEISSSSLAPSP